MKNFRQYLFSDENLEAVAPILAKSRNLKHHIGVRFNAVTAIWPDMETILVRTIVLMHAAGEDPTFIKDSVDGVVQRYLKQVAFDARFCDWSDGREFAALFNDLMEMCLALPRVRELLRIKCDYYEWVENLTDEQLLRVKFYSTISTKGACFLIYESASDVGLLGVHGFALPEPVFGRDMEYHQGELMPRDAEMKPA